MSAPSIRIRPRLVHGDPVVQVREPLADYHLAHSARADLCRRLGRTDEATVAYRRALELVRQEPERRFIARRLTELP